MHRSTRWSFALALALALLPVRAVGAQTIWTPLDHRSTVRLEWRHPHVRGSDLSPTSGPLFFSAGFPVDENIALSLELPYARAAERRSPSGSYREGTMGNPYFGVQLGSRRRPVSFVGEIGLRPDMANGNRDLALHTATLADIERTEAFLAGVTTIVGAGNIVVRRPSSASRIRVAVSELVFGAGYGDNALTYLDYGAQTSVDVGRLRFGGAFNGRFLADGSGGFGDRSTHALSGMASFASGALRPAVAIQLPLDGKRRATLPFIVALSLEHTVH